MNVKLGHPVVNRFKVPLKKWNQWSNHAKRVFNDMYHELRVSMQATYSHPNALPVPKEHWTTLQWNVAWLAANAADNLKTLDRPQNSELHEHRGTTKSKAAKRWKRHEKKHPKRVVKSKKVPLGRKQALKSIAKKKGKRRGKR